jgi:hypothetical protein
MKEQYRVENKSNANMRGPVTTFDVYTWNADAAGYVFSGHSWASGRNASDAKCITAWLERETEESEIY